jgi:uncharacterized membrane protein HdeD (DUF308 family)
MNLESHLEEGERLIARAWKTLALRGVVAIAFGIVAVAWPDMGLTTLLALVGAFALVAGLTALYGAYRAPVNRARRAWLALDGVLAIAFAVLVLVWPDLSARGLLFAIAAWAVATGIVEFGLGAAVLPVTGPRSLLLMFWGVVSAAFGAIMFARPGAGALALLALVAAFAIVTGVTQVAYAVELRRLAGELERRLSPRPSPKPALHG